MQPWSDDILGWLALYMIPGLGNNSFNALLKRFGSPQAVFEADLSDLLDVREIRKDVAHNIIRKKFVKDPEAELRKVERLGARIITFRDPSYPPLLREIHYPPMLLYVRGKDIPDELMLIAMVGSRNATPYGLKTAEKIAFSLAKSGVGTVSGLAKGIDAAAHTGSIRGGGFTIAVTGTGIDIVYPATNRKLLDQVVETGAVISEFPLGTPPEPKNFPIRNRIISGLSRGVAVIEATRKSGSLITAAFALDQGREVFAVPGSIESFKSKGTHFLIKEGARLIENANDILDEFGLGDRQAGKNGIKGTDPVPPAGMTRPEKEVYELIGEYPVHIDQIVRDSQMDAGEILSILMRMELRGLVRQLPGKMFVR